MRVATMCSCVVLCWLLDYSGDARQAVLGELGAPATPPAEAVALDEALGRVLAAEVRADRDQPPFDRVTRDGFAVRAADVASATEEDPVTLSIVGSAPIGRQPDATVGGGEAIRIATGSPIPAGVCGRR